MIICHNYGRYLAEAIDSVLSQSRRGDELLVIDDRSTDDTAAVAQQFAEHGVSYLSVDYGNAHDARRAGFEATSAEAICFLDADDRLRSDYLEHALKQFTESNVAVVYSDYEEFGRRARRVSFPDEYSHHLLQQDNYIHAGSVVRRAALISSQAFDCVIDPLYTQADWHLWKRVLRGNWVARKQNGLYFYRQHGHNWTHQMRSKWRTDSYFDYAGLRYEDVTLFVPLSGRTWSWQQLGEFLTTQEWPHDRTRLVLFDTSQNPSFSQEVREWIAHSDYSDVRHVLQRVASKGVADHNRRESEVREQVVHAMWRIYNRMLEDVSTEYIWILEDDIHPDRDVCERLLRGFDAQTASVAAPYRSRFEAGYVAWDRNGRTLSQPGQGLQVVGGNGFGCTIVRRSALHGRVFSGFGRAQDFDVAFYRHLGASNMCGKVDWNTSAVHLDTPVSNSMHP